MNRRELLSTSAGSMAALALTIPAFGKCTAANNYCKPITWKSNDTIEYFKSKMQPQLQRVKETKKLTTLTPVEWKTLYYWHLCLGNAHSEIGNLRATDLWNESHQAELVHKCGAKATDRALTLGTHAIWSQDATAFMTVGNALSKKNDSIEPYEIGAQQCADMKVYALDIGILTLFSAGLGLEGWAIFFGLIDIGLILTEVYFCQ